MDVSHLIGKFVRVISGCGTFCGILEWFSERHGYYSITVSGDGKEVANITFDNRRVGKVFDFGPNSDKQPTIFVGDEYAID